MQTLNEELDPIPFSELTDVYSFGLVSITLFHYNPSLTILSCRTIWYELITNCFPFAHLLSDCIIWQVGRGLKAPLSETNDVCPEAKVKCILYMVDWLKSLIYLTPSISNHVQRHSIILDKISKISSYILPRFNLKYLRFILISESFNFTHVAVGWGISRHFYKFNL